MAVWGWVIVAIVVVVLATLAWGMLRTRRTRRLPPQSGSENDREVSESETQRDAESGLETRRKPPGVQEP
jgi:cytoskeletal protein RodZ